MLTPQPPRLSRLPNQTEIDAAIERSAKSTGEKWQQEALEVVREYLLANRWMHTDDLNDKLPPLPNGKVYSRGRGLSLIHI